MQRRDFLKQGLTVSAALILGGLPKGVQDAYGTEGSWRTFEVTTRLAIREATGAVYAWVPVPLLNSTDYFVRESDRWTGNSTVAQALPYDRYGTGMVVA